MKTIKPKFILFFMILLCTLKMYAQGGIYNISETENVSLLFKEHANLWEKLNTKYLEQLNHVKDSINGSATLDDFGQRYIRAIDEKIIKQEGSYYGVHERDDFNIGKVYQYKQDSIFEVFMKEQNVSYIFGVDYQDIPGVLYAKENLDYTDQLRLKTTNSTGAKKNNITNTVIAFFDISKFKGNYEGIISKHTSKKIRSKEYYNDSDSISKDISKLVKVIKKATKLVAEENNIDIVLNSINPNSNWESLLLKGSTSFDITPQVIAKYQGKPSGNRNILKPSAKIAGVHSKELFALLLQMHPLIVEQKKELLEKYQKLIDVALESDKKREAQEFADQYAGEITKLEESASKVIKEELIKESQNIATSSGYDILLAIDNEHTTHFFSHRKYIHLLQNDIISKKVAEFFQEKYGK